jgi:hypothetical protein
MDITMKFQMPKRKMRQVNPKSGEAMAQLTETRREKPMLLMACVHRGEEMEEQKTVILDVSREIGSCLDVCVMDEEQDKLFVRKHHIGGTPTYILFSDSEEKARLLGKVDARTLYQFIRMHQSRDENQN